MAKRKNNTYKYEKGKSFKVSRSGIDSFIKCPRCFYINKVLNIKDIGGPGFSLNSAVDELLKKEFDYYREKKAPHPITKTINRTIIPYQHEDLELWRNNFKGVSYHHKETDLIISGAVDDVWVEVETDKLIVVEYKSTSTSKEISLDDGTEWKEAYKRQIDIYQWLLRKNNFEVSDISYFVYVNGLKNLDMFDNTLHFETFLLEYTGSDEWVESVIFEIKNLLDMKSIPKSNENCETCSYVQSVFEEENYETNKL